ncbi:MAG: protein imuB [Phycisphaerales bacterium]|nr:protein imuB [Phycisphaerales bacterium]
MAIVRVVGQRRVVLDVSRQAKARGARRGMSVAEVRALCANLICVEADPDADRRALEALARWLMRFTPVVSAGWDGDDDDREQTPSALFLDLTGCERLFGGLGRLVDLIKGSLARFDIPAQMAVAPTPGAAWALAVVCEKGVNIVDATSLHGALMPLPVDLLRLDDAVLDDLHHLGLHRMGEVLSLPREQLTARFGPSLLMRLDQLTGALIEPLTKLVNSPPITAKLEFDAPIEEPQSIGLIFEKLLDLVLSDLARRNHGVRQLRLIVTPDRGWGRPTITRTIALSRPHRDRSTLVSLIRCEIERVDCEHGFVRFKLDVPLHEALAGGQAHLFDQRLVEERSALDRLLERLRGRLGEASVVRPERVESYLPEHAWRPTRLDAVAPVVVAQLPHAPPRPLTLFPTPVEIRVVCEPSDDHVGPPRQFAWRENIYRLTHAVGPERIAGEWWRGHRHTRDYYDVGDEAGLRFWLFRVLHRRDGRFVARWFLHGRFD